MDNLNAFMDELTFCEHFKIKFDKTLIDEVNAFIDSYQNTYSEIIDEFKLLLKLINSQVNHIQIYSDFDVGN
jgi:hypothetical protein